MKALARRLLCALLMVAQCALPVWAAPVYDTASTDESRLALVIGNSAYLVDPLDNPVNDANAVARSLERLGFEVMLAINLPGAELKRRVRTFQARARAERGTALVYYAGHAVAPAGRNILLPVDINFRDVLEVEDEGIDVAKMLAILEDSKKHTRIMIFDACRDNPYGQVGEALIRTTARARGIDMGQHLAAHAGLPELAQVRGHAVDGLLPVGHGLEELADAVGHVDEVVDVHGRCSGCGVRLQALGVGVGDQVVATHEAQQQLAAGLGGVHRQRGGGGHGGQHGHAGARGLLHHLETGAAGDADEALGRVDARAQQGADQRPAQRQRILGAAGIDLAQRLLRPMQRN